MKAPGNALGVGEGNRVAAVRALIVRRDVLFHFKLAAMLAFGIPLSFLAPAVFTPLVQMMLLRFHIYGVLGSGDWVTGAEGGAGARHTC